MYSAFVNFYGLEEGLNEGFDIDRRFFGQLNRPVIQFVSARTPGFQKAPGFKMVLRLPLDRLYAVVSDRPLPVLKKRHVHPLLCATHTTLCDRARHKLAVEYVVDGMGSGVPRSCPSIFALIAKVSESEWDRAKVITQLSWTISMRQQVSAHFKFSEGEVDAVATV